MHVVKKNFLKLSAVFFVTIPTITAISCTQSNEVSQDQKDVNAIARQIKLNQIVEKSTTFVTWELGASISKSDLGVVEPEEKLGVSITYKVGGVQHVSGKVYVYVHLVKNNANKKLEISVSGFQKINDHYEKNKARLIALTKTKKLVTKKTHLTSDYVIDEKIGVPTKLADLGLDPIFTEEELNGFTAEYIPAKATSGQDMQITIDIKFSMVYRLEDFTTKDTSKRYFKTEAIITGFLDPLGREKSC